MTIRSRLLSVNVYTDGSVWKRRITDHRPSRSRRHRASPSRPGRASYSGAVSEGTRALDLGDRKNAGLAVGAGGMLALAVGWILDSRALSTFGLLAAAVGGGLYARRRLAERREEIEAAESSIRSTLSDLDPIAQAQVVRGLVSDPDES